MSFANRPDRLVCDAYSDTTLEIQNPNGVYNRFTNRLTTPILNAKGLMLLNANFVNPILQLNDAYSLMFFYYASTTQTNIRTIANLKCIRLYPSNFVVGAVTSAFTQNKYFNTVAELVSTLNTAASTGGDNVVYNPLWRAGDLTFTYDSSTRKISVMSAGTYYISPAAADDPYVLGQLANGNGTSTNIIKMANYNSSAYSSATVQPYVAGLSMNARLGFAMSYYSRGLWWDVNAQVGCANSVGQPLLYQAIAADANPILIGSQNINVYCDAVVGSGIDSLRGKNLLATIPLESPALNVNSYTLSSVEKPALSVSNEIYELTFDFRDDNGVPVYFPPNYNTELQISVFY